MTKKFHGLDEAEGAVAVGSSDVLGLRLLAPSGYIQKHTTAKHQQSTKEKPGNYYLPSKIGMTRDLGTP